MSGVYTRTKEGRELYANLREQAQFAKNKRTVPAFRLMVEKMAKDANTELTHFLNNKEMARKYKMDEEDSVGWNMFKIMDDRCSVLNYFLRAVK